MRRNHYTEVFVLYLFISGNLAPTISSSCCFCWPPHGPYEELVTKNVTALIEATRSVCIPTEWVGIRRCRDVIPALSLFERLSQAIFWAVMLASEVSFPRAIRGEHNQKERVTIRLIMNRFKKMGSLEYRNLLFR